MASGTGKLHFHETATAAALAGAQVEFITGWIPGPEQEKIADWLGTRLGEASLAKRLRARVVDLPGVTMRPIAWAEFAGRGVSLLSRAPGLRNLDSSAWSFQLAGSASRKYLKNADIFHVRSGGGQGGAIRTARKHGLKILTDHSIAHPAYMEAVLGEEYARAGLKIDPIVGSGLWDMVLKDCSEADLLLVNSDFVKRTFVEMGFPEDRLRVAYLGVRESYFSLKTSYDINGPLKILFTGNFDLRKGTGVLLEAIRKVRAGGLDTRLHLIGNMGNGKVWMKDSDAEFFTHTPFVPPDVLRPTLAESDLFVFPTLIEGSSRSAMEAAAAGLPLITTDNCGMPFEHGKTVYYVPLNDANALAEAIARLATNQDLRQSIGTNSARMVAKQYTWPQYGEQLMQIYKSMT